MAMLSRKSIRPWDLRTSQRVTSPAPVSPCSRFQSVQGCGHQEPGKVQEPHAENQQNAGQQKGQIDVQTKKC